MVHIKYFLCNFAIMFLYNFILNYSEMPVSELSLELLLLQVVVPALLEQGHTRTWMRGVVRGWCVVASKLLDMRSYLLGDVNQVREY